MSESIEWKDIRGYEGYYQVSRDGLIKGLARTATHPDGGTHHIPGRFIAQGKKPNGYLHAKMCKNGVQRTFYVHRLVASAFINNLEGYKCVNHKDGDKKNNCVENLEWCTNEQNMAHALELGLANQRGSNHSQAILDEEKVRSIRELLSSGIASKKVAQMFGVTSAVISGIKCGRSWRHVA